MIKIKKINGWFEFSDENNQPLSCRFTPVIDGIWEVSVNDHGLERGFSIGKIEQSGDGSFYFVPNIGIEIKI